MNQAKFTCNLFIMIVGLILVALNIVSEGLILDVIGKMLYAALNVVLPLV